MYGYEVLADTPLILYPVHLLNLIGNLIMIIIIIILQDCICAHLDHYNFSREINIKYQLQSTSP